MRNNFFGLRFLALLFLFVLSSWVVVHILALTGVFFAITYPLWWVFLPKQTICFFCRSKQDGSFCPVCKKKINKSTGVFPKSFSSVVINSCLIFLFSIISIGIVFGESKLLISLGLLPTPRKVSFVIPPNGQYRLGEIFPMKIEIADAQKAINAVQADISFDKNKIELVHISTEGSFANVFIQKEINNEMGYARLTGGVPNPGFISGNGMFGTFYFKGKEPGLVKVEYLPSSLVLANDGRGTNVLKELASVSYLVLPERISKEEEDLQGSSFVSSNILGVNNNQTQLTFYDEQRVEGEVHPLEENKNTMNLIQSTFLFLEKVDGLVLKIYRII